MCLVSRYKEPKVAEKDITVYKIVREVPRGYSSHFEAFFYKSGKLYKTRMSKSNGGCLDTRERIETSHYTTKFYIERGFHSAATKTRLKHLVDGDAIIVKGTIPKGSLYYRNASNLLVSNQIILH
jgi:hypothetical protein